MTALTREPSGRRASTVGLSRVDPPAQGQDDFLDDAHDLLVIFEGDVGLGQLAFALDINAFGAVDHDFADFGVIEQGLERTKAQQLVQNFMEELVAHGVGQLEPRVLVSLLEQLADHFSAIFSLRSAALPSRATPDRSGNHAVCSVPPGADLMPGLFIVHLLLPVSSSAGITQTICSRLTERKVNWCSKLPPIHPEFRPSVTATNF